MQEEINTGPEQPLTPNLLTPRSGDVIRGISNELSDLAVLNDVHLLRKTLERLAIKALILEPSPDAPGKMEAGTVIMDESRLQSETIESLERTLFEMCIRPEGELLNVDDYRDYIRSPRFRTCELMRHHNFDLTGILRAFKYSKATIITVFGLGLLERRSINNAPRVIESLGSI